MHPVFSLVLDTLGIIIFFKPVEEFFYLSNSQEFLVIFRRYEEIHFTGYCLKVEHWY